MSRITDLNVKQTKIKLENGQRFKAKVVTHDNCKGCYFRSSDDACPTIPTDDCGSYCSPASRNDGQWIVWKERKEKTQ